MLVFIADEKSWSGQPIDGIRYPLNIEQIWSDADLAAIGLAKFVPPLPEPEPLTAGHVRAEAQRRIIALMDARDIEHCIIKQLNANMRANELNDKRATGGQLTAEEVSEAQILRDMAAGIKAIRTASNAIETMVPIPEDYADNSRWPS